MSKDIEKPAGDNPSAEFASPQPIDWQERMVVMEQYGFLPTSSDELNRAMTVIDYLSTPRKVGGHLNEILLHNRSYKADDPAAATKSVVRGFEFWAKDALASAAQHQKLIDELAAVNPAINALVIYDTEDQNDAEDILDAVSGLVKHDNLVKAIASGDQAVLATALTKSDSGKKEKSVKTTNNQITDDDKKLFLSKHTVLEIRKLAEVQIEQQAHRFAFWREVIAQSDNHMAVAAMIKQILPKLDEQAGHVIN